MPRSLLWLLRLTLCSDVAGFQPSMEANYAEIAKRRRSKGLSVAVPVITDPLDENAGKGRTADAQPLKSTAAGGTRPEGIEVAPAPQGGAKTVLSALDATETGTNKRRRTSTANGTRTKGMIRTHHLVSSTRREISLRSSYNQPASVCQLASFAFHSATSVH